jgi:hypothetical protein
MQMLDIVDPATVSIASELYRMLLIQSSVESSATGKPSNVHSSETTDDIDNRESAI